MPPPERMAAGPSEGIRYHPPRGSAGSTQRRLVFHRDCTGERVELSVEASPHHPLPALDLLDRRPGRSRTRHAGRFRERSPACRDLRAGVRTLPGFRYPAWRANLACRLRTRRHRARRALLGRPCGWRPCTQAEPADSPGRRQRTARSARPPAAPRACGWRAMAARHPGRRSARRTG